MSWYFFGGFSAYWIVPSGRWRNHSGCSVTHGWSGEHWNARSSASSMPCVARAARPARSKSSSVPSSGWTAVWPPSAAPIAHGLPDVAGRRRSVGVVAALAVGRRRSGGSAAGRGRRSPCAAIVEQRRVDVARACRGGPSAERAGEELVPGGEAGPRRGRPTRARLEVGVGARAARGACGASARPAPGRAPPRSAARGVVRGRRVAPLPSSPSAAAGAAAAAASHEPRADLRGRPRRPGRRRRAARARAPGAEAVDPRPHRVERGGRARRPGTRRRSGRCRAAPSAPRASGARPRGGGGRPRRRRRGRRRTRRRCTSTRVAGDPLDGEAAAVDARAEVLDHDPPPAVDVGNGAARSWLAALAMGVRTLDDRGLSGARRPECPVPGTGSRSRSGGPGLPHSGAPGVSPSGEPCSGPALSRRARGSAPLRYGGGSFVLPRAHWVTARKTIRKRAVNSLVRDGRGSVSRRCGCA